MRIGIGYDVHAFEAGNHLMLCGVSVPFNKGFKAHSDGDVAVHALIDAMLGAAALGDIGLHYPDNDEKWKNSDSMLLLQDSYAKIRAEGYVLTNADMTIVAERPKLRPYIEQMQASLADALHIQYSQINVKATTSEGMGFVGRQEGVAVHAVVLLSA